MKRILLTTLAMSMLSLSPAVGQTQGDFTVEENARAVLMIGLFSPDPSEALLEHIEAGGRAVLLFGGATRDQSRVTRLTQQLHCAGDGPMLVAVDQEPGPVARLRGLVAPLPDPDGADPEQLGEAATLLGRDMRRLGINLDLAPVVDVPRGPNPVLANRTFGDNPTTVGELGSIFVAALAESGIASAAKHFPGHGLSRTDPHTSINRITASFDELGAVDLAPFRALIDNGVQAVLVAHPIYEAIDPNLPASLSPVAYSLLRDDLGFTGVAITDGLGMRAVSAGRSLEEVSVLAVSAGADLLIVESEFDIDRVVAALLAALQTGELSKERLVEAADRVRDLAANTSWPGCVGARRHS